MLPHDGVYYKIILDVIRNTFHQLETHNCDFYCCVFWIHQPSYQGIALGWESGFRKKNYLRSLANKFIACTLEASRSAKNNTDINVHANTFDQCSHWEVQNGGTYLMFMRLLQLLNSYISSNFMKHLNWCALNSSQWKLSSTYRQTPLPLCSFPTLSIIQPPLISTNSLVFSQEADLK